MRSKKRLVTTAIIMAVMLTMIVPSAYGVQPENAGTLYSVYLDWLQGKPVGLASIEVSTDRSVEDATIVIVDYTFGEPKILYVGSSKTPTVKIKRIPERTESITIVRDGKTYEEVKTVYREVTLLVIVSGKQYWGTQFIQFSPEKPLSKVIAKINLHEGKADRSLKGYSFSATSVYLGEMDISDIKIFTLHSVPGVTQKLVIDEDDKIAIDSFSQTTSISEEVDPYGWVPSGKVNTPFGYSSEVPTSNGKMNIVYATVTYRVDKYYICGNLMCRAVYELVPQEIAGFSGIEEQNDPGTIPSNLRKYAHLRSAGNSFNIYFHDNRDDGGVYFSSAVSGYIGTGVSICFTGTVNTYRASESSHRPSFNITITRWYGNKLYYAKYSQEGNYYEVPLEWGS